MMRCLFFIFIFSLCSFGVLEAQASSGSDSDPDKMIAAIEQLRKTTDFEAAGRATSTLKQEKWETDSEFIDRKEQAFREKLENSAYELSLLDFIVPSKFISVKASAFNRAEKTWNLQVNCSDPAIPFKDSVILSIKTAEDMGKAFFPVDDAITDNHLSAVLTYHIFTDLMGNYRTVVEKITILDSSTQITLKEFPVWAAWKFNPGNRKTPSTLDYKAVITQYLDLSKKFGDAVSKDDTSAQIKIATDMSTLAALTTAAIQIMPAADQDKATEEFSKVCYKTLIAQYIVLGRKFSDAVTKGDIAAVTKMSTVISTLDAQIPAAIQKLPPAYQAKAAEEFAKAAGGF